MRSAGIHSTTQNLNPRRVFSGSQGLGCSGSGGDLQGAGGRADYGAVCLSSRWTGRQICLPSCAPLLPTGPRG